MSSRQCRGGGGSSSGASVSLISSPQTLQRYLTLTLRSSPAGGGGDIGAEKLRSRPVPLFHRTKPMARPAKSQRIVDSAGITLRLSVRFDRLRRERVVDADPSQRVCGIDATFLHLGEHRSKPSKFVGRCDAEPQRIGFGNADACLARRPMECVEMLAGEWWGKEPAQRFAPTALRAHRGSQCVHFVMRAHES
jgi:hypothetical protein